MTPEPPKGKIRHDATVTCAFPDCGCEATAISPGYTATFRAAGWTVRSGPRKTDGRNWRCPSHPYPEPEYPGYY